MSSIDNVTICKNCSREVSGNFCSNCGQKVTEKFTFNLLLKEFLATFLNLEKGFFFTMVKLTTAPGKVIKGFLGGERKKYQHPLSYLILSVALVSLSLLLVSSEEQVQSLIGEASKSSPENPFFLQNFNKYINVLLFGIIPFISFFTYLFFRSFKFNFAEHLIINSFILAQINIFNLLFALVIFLSPFKAAVEIETFAFFTQIAYVAWAHFDVFHRKVLSIFKSLISFILASIIITFILVAMMLFIGSL